MKTKSILTAVAITGIALLFASCSETVNSVEDMLASADEKSSEVEAYYGDSCTFSGVLTEAEIAGLMEMREEEKLAHDVYTFFFEKYDYIIFNNIAESEQAHTNAVSRLINGYELEDPALAERGKFTNPDFNDLYTTLTEQGSESFAAALKVGAFIEEYDINDLQNLLGETQNDDVIRVYSNLLRGSESHLRAFTKVLGQYGEIYEPVVISVAEYESILAAENSGVNRYGTKTGYGNGGGNTNNYGNGARYGTGNSSNGNQNKNSNSSGSENCDGTGPNS